MPKTPVWRQTRNTDYVSYWEWRDYRLVGRGRMYGTKLVRDWEVWYRNRQLETAFRLSEAKQVAERHFANRPPIAMTIFAVAIISPMDRTTFEEFYVSQANAQIAADEHNKRFPKSPPATVKPIEVQP